MQSIVSWTPCHLIFSTSTLHPHLTHHSHNTFKSLFCSCYFFLTNATLCSCSCFNRCLFQPFLLPFHHIHFDSSINFVSSPHHVLWLWQFKCFRFMLLLWSLFMTLFFSFVIISLGYEYCNVLHNLCITTACNPICVFVFSSHCFHFRTRKKSFRSSIVCR